MNRPLFILALLSQLASAQTSVEATPAAATPKAVVTAEWLANVKPLEAILDKVLKAYNAGDARAFWADAATKATPPPTPGTFKSLFEDYYKADFGKYLAKTLINGETFPDPALGVIVYEAKFEKRPKVKVSANFTREDGALRLMQIRFEKM